MTFSVKIKELRLEKNLLLKDISDILGVSRSICGRYETGYSIIPLKHLNTLVNYFNVSFDYIFNLTDERNYSDYKKDIDRKIVGERIKLFRKEYKLTQVKLADILNTVHPTITNYENGKNLIATAFLYEICKKYKISADYLLGKIDEPKYIE